MSDGVIEKSSKYVCKEEKDLYLYNNDSWKEYLDECGSTKIVNIAGKLKDMDTKTDVSIAEIKNRVSSKELQMNFMYVTEVHFDKYEKNCSRKF